MNYAQYIEEKSGEIQALLDKQKLGLCRINENLIVSMPVDQIPRATFVTSRELVLCVIEGEQRVETYNSEPSTDGLFADLCNRAPYMISALLLGSTAAEKGMKAALALLIPITAAFVLTRMITRRLDAKKQDIQHDKEKDLAHIIGYGSEASTHALQNKPFEGNVAKKSIAIIERQINNLKRNEDIWHPLVKLSIKKRRHHYRHG